MLGAKSSQVLAIIASQQEEAQILSGKLARLSGTGCIITLIQMSAVVVASKIFKMLFQAMANQKLEAALEIWADDCSGSDIYCSYKILLSISHISFGGI